MHRTTLTLTIVSEMPIHSGISLADVAFLCCTQFWHLESVKLTSRPATREEAAAAMAAHVPDELGNLAEVLRLPAAEVAS